MMRAYCEMNKEELLALHEDLSKQYQVIKEKGLSLNMARGKPDLEQIGLSLNILDTLNSQYDFSQKMDYCNYGILDGISEAKIFLQKCYQQKLKMSLYMVIQV